MPPLATQPRTVHRVPGDKSITHRALMLAALADGRSTIRGALVSLDTRSTAVALGQLGPVVPELKQDATIIVDGRSSWSPPAHSLDCGNSGTTARLLMGLLAGRPFETRLIGDASLSQRPMARVTDPLAEMGARFPGGGSQLPLTIIGGELSELTWRLPVASAQIKSAIIFAGLAAGVPIKLWEPGPSRDHTERMLAGFGFDFTRNGSELSFHPTGRIEPFELEVPGDPSSAAFLLAAAALGQAGEVVIGGVGLNPTRTGFLEVMKRMGVPVVIEVESESGGEPVGRIGTRRADLGPVEVLAEEIPFLIDEVPILACLASRAAGVSRFRGLAELRVKESDRLNRLAENLRAVGADAVVEGDDLVVVGGAGRLCGMAKSGGDHRMAMAFAVLDPAIEVDEPGVAEVSFPGFATALARVRGGRDDS